MQFDPLVHTKEYLLSNTDVAFDLARHSEDFAKYDLANELEILKLVNIDGWTVAHQIAKCQSEWVHSEAAKSIEILKLSNFYGWTVAHELARYQSEWLFSEAAKSLEILKLAENNGQTVAHWLARCQSEWIHSETAESFEILKLTDHNGKTVAHMMAHCEEWIHSEAAKNAEILKLAENNGQTVALLLALFNKNCLNHEPLFQKQVLTLEYKERSLAEEISEMFKSKGFDLPVMAMKLISQGAAYRHSKLIAIKSGEAILKQCKTLIEDGLDPLVNLKQLQALYSTFSHNVSKIISTQEQETLQKWQGLLLQSENLIRKYLDKHPDLYDIEHTIDIFCEPGDNLIKRIQAKRNLNLTSLDELETEKDTELTAFEKGIY